MPKQENQPDRRPRKTLEDDEIVRRLSNLGFEEDEIKTLYPTEESRAEFYHEVAGSSSELTSDENEDDGLGKWEEDAYVPTPKQEAEVKRLKQGVQQAQVKLTKVVSAAKDGLKKAKFSAEQASLPEDARVTAEEFEEAGKDLRSLLDGLESEESSSDDKPGKKKKKKK